MEIFAFIVGVVALIVAWTTRSRVGALSRDLVDLRRELELTRDRLARVGGAASATGVVAPAAETHEAPLRGPAPTVDEPAPSATTATPSTEPRATTPEPRAGIPAPAAIEPVVSGFAPPDALPPDEPPPRPPRRPIEWEALLGVRGAAWLGAVALAIAGTLFAKYSFEHDLVPPALRVALVLLAGLGSIVGAELSLRRRYAVTANAAAGAGVALLYAGIFAAHGLYDLIGVVVAFGLMVLVTAVAALLALRYDAMVVAVIGLLGGFATPVLVSSGHDRPVGLFSYLLLLNVGLFWVLLRKRWYKLSILSFAATALVAVGWAVKYLEPEKVLVASAAFGLLGLAYVLLPLLAKGDDRTLARVGVAAGQAPFLFALFVAQDPSYVGSWPVTFGLVACLDAAFAVLVLRRDQVVLYLGGAVGTALFLLVFGAATLSRGLYVGASAAAAALVVVVNLVSVLGATRLARAPSARPALLEIGGAVAGLGLASFGVALVAQGLAEPPGALAMVLVGLLLVVALRAGPTRLAPVAIAAPVVTTLVATLGYFAMAAPETAWRDVALFALAPVGAALVLAARGRWVLDRDARPEAMGVLVSTAVGFLVLYAALTDPSTGHRVAPLVALLALIAGLALVLALRDRWAPVAPVTVLLVALFAGVWQHDFYEPEAAVVALGAWLTAYAVLLVYPFVVSRFVRPRWREEVTPWLASALAGPLLFWPVYDAVVRRFGNLAIGLLPLGFAVVSMAALYRVYLVFHDAGAESPLARARLRNLALFAAVALGFVAVAIPLQLERQWITLGWALEGVAAVWLFGRLPHPGLKYLAAVLYGAVFVRLVLNPSVLAYHHRGLPVLNWILYTYGVAAVTFLVGSVLLERVERPRLEAWEQRFYPRAIGLAPVIGLLGLVVIFALINLEIADFFSTGPGIDWEWERRAARDVTMSVAWGVYALVLLAVGIVRKGRALRFVSLAFMLLAIGKTFLYDLSSLQGLYRVLSFLGLAFALIVVSLVYQRFVFPRPEHELETAPEARP